MFLSRTSIKRRVEEGSLIFSPALAETAYQPAGVQLRLDSTILVPKAGRIDFRTKPEFDGERIVIDESGFELRPGMFVIGRTLEKVTIPLDIVGFLDGTSTLARHDMTTHQGACHIWPGHGFKRERVDGQWKPEPRHITLEIFNGGPHTIILATGISAANLSFGLLDQPVEGPYDAGGPGFGRYFEDSMAPVVTVQ